MSKFSLYHENKINCAYKFPEHFPFHFTNGQNAKQKTKQQKVVIKQMKNTVLD